MRISPSSEQVWTPMARRCVHNSHSREQPHQFPKGEPMQMCVYLNVTAAHVQTPLPALRCGSAQHWASLFLTTPSLTHTRKIHAQQMRRKRASMGRRQKQEGPAPSRSSHHHRQARGRRTGCSGCPIAPRCEHTLTHGSAILAASAERRAPMHLRTVVQRCVKNCFGCHT